MPVSRHGGKRRQWITARNKRAFNSWRADRQEKILGRVRAYRMRLQEESAARKKAVKAKKKKRK